MTASITIVNTSNWDGEDFRVVREGEKGTRLLRPGEVLEIHPEHASDDPIELAVHPEFSKKTAPIEVPQVVAYPEGGARRQNKQVFPKVRVTFEP